jgi:hypothetical protein
MIDEHLILHRLEEQRRELRRRAERSRLLAAAGRPRPRRPLAAVRGAIGMGLVRLGARLAGPPAARTHAGS